MKQKYHNKTFEKQSRYFKREVNRPKCLPKKSNTNKLLIDATQEFGKTKQTQTQ